MPIFKVKYVIDSEINETGELVLKEDSKRIKYLFGVKIFEREYNRTTSQTDLHIKGEGADPIGFTKTSK